jgi:DNA helicase-2/ATP-dependent DNA helicase PcrA
LVRQFYGPFLDEHYDYAEPRQRDLEQLEQLASRFANRRTLLTELALDPPTTTEALAGPAHLDEDYLVLSTMHSAKGLEWDAVYVIHAADGNIPSDMATGDTAQIDEERRLFYVALTRARNWLYVCFPQRYYHAARGRFSDRYGYAQLTRFLPRDIQSGLQCRIAGTAPPAGEPDPAERAAARQNIRNQVKALWS